MKYSGFFAEKAYDERIYDMSDTVIPYKDYTAGKLATTRSGANQPSTVIRILCRGRSKRVDLFLDWLVSHRRPLVPFIC